eukprot:15145143-Ditylum_brightwellii.AAC.1
MQTIAGNFSTICEVDLREIILPELDRTKRIDRIVVHVFDAKCNYNMILGRNFLINAGIILDFEHSLICWLDHQIAMKPAIQWRSGEMMAVDDYLSLYNDKAG